VERKEKKQVGGLKQLIGRMFNAIVQSQNVTITVYPITGAGAKRSAGQALASAAAANTWGNWTPIIAAATITTEYWYLGTHLQSVGVNGEDGACQIGHTDGTGPPPALIRRIDEIEWGLFTALGTDLGNPLVAAVLPIRLIANAELSGRSATLNAAAKNVTVSVKIATGL
jgi:hypothetical protein